MSYAYFPGCSLHSTGLEYGLSTEAVLDHLGSGLVELPDWNCCGASSAHALDHTLSLALPARNLAKAQLLGKDLVTPCAACYNRMKTADYYLKKDPKQRAELEEIVGFEYQGTVKIRPVLAVVYEDFGVERLQRNIKNPLNSLVVVPYYGCLLVRPPEIAQFDDPENPRVMGMILEAIGAQVQSWSYATDCCGGSLSLSNPYLVQRLVGGLIEHAREAGAMALVTACPLCQVNLEMRQSEEEKMPVFYFTELLGLAFGLPETQTWWSKHLIDPRSLLKKLGLVH